MVLLGKKYLVKSILGGVVFTITVAFLSIFLSSERDMGSKYTIRESCFERVIISSFRSPFPLIQSLYSGLSISWNASSNRSTPLRLKMLPVYIITFSFAFSTGSSYSSFWKIPSISVHVFPSIGRRSCIPSLSNE